MGLLSRWRGAQRSSKPPVKRRFLPILESLEHRLVFAVNISVDAAAGQHLIDANIYGTAHADTAALIDLNSPLNREGGNMASTYNWQQNASNHGNDWYFESIADGPGVPSQSADSFVSATKAGGAQASLTIPMLDYIAKLGANRSILGSYSTTKYGAQQDTDPWLPTAGNGILTNSQAITWNNPNDANTPNSVALQQAWVQHLIATFGNSGSGGLRYYTMDNEPGLWDETHQDVHPNGTTMTELRDKIIAYASMVKALDPGAKILGPEEWGWTNYFISGADAAAENWGATYNGMAAMPWLLDQLRQYNVTTGQRLLDYFTLHYYPQGNEFSDDVSTATQLLRNQSTRSLWDPNYVDQSWVGTTGINGGKVNLIPMMHSWVNSYYPGTKIGITEYNWGAEGHMNGATTQADVLGIFGREGLDLANRWETPAVGTPTYLAMKMYRNYDGNDSTFGDTSVSTSAPNPDQVAAYSAVRSSDGALTIMVINKNLYSASNPGATTSITINVSNFETGGVAQQWQLAAINPSNQTNAAITRLADVHFTGNSFTFSVPMQSIELFVLMPSQTGAPAAPSTLAAMAGNGQVSLGWSAVNGATSYNVYRATSSGGEGGTPVATGVTGTSFSDTGLTNGITYYYQVTAVNGSGESFKSGEASATPSLHPADRVAVFRNGTWFLSAVNSDYSSATTRVVQFGAAGDTAVTGDWVGDGQARVGVFRAGTWFLDMNNGDYAPATTVQIAFGAPGDIPVVGRWEGGSVDLIGVFRPGTGQWFLSSVNAGYTPDATRQIDFGARGDTPVVGDWTAAGFSKIGIFRPGTGQWFLSMFNTDYASFSTIQIDNFGGAGDVAVVGDWLDDGRTYIGIYRPSAGSWFLSKANANYRQSNTLQVDFGESGDVPLVGDWTGTGTSRIGVFRAGQWLLDMSSDASLGNVIVLSFGSPGDVPQMGAWR
ncbi:MAG: hypothetical protein K2R98_03780 [Gemmataceae bacterium]|nr:hypothetical protein [Gemmataceae bacterium]